MWNCAYCDKPLICEACNTEVIPADESFYEALNDVDKPVFCLECEALLVCHWCKTPYDGTREADS